VGRGAGRRPGGLTTEAGESNVKRALKWVTDRLTREPGARRGDLIDQASREFDLTPLEAEFLYRQLTETRKKPDTAP
jgi:hypothetical protein